MMCKIGNFEIVTPMQGVLIYYKADGKRYTIGAIGDTGITGI